MQQSNENIPKIHTRHKNLPYLVIFMVIYFILIICVKIFYIDSNNKTTGSVNSTDERISAVQIIGDTNVHFSLKSNTDIYMIKTNFELNTVNFDGNYSIKIINEQTNEIIFKNDYPLINIYDKNNNYINFKSLLGHNLPSGTYDVYFSFYNIIPLIDDLEIQEGLMIYTAHSNNDIIVTNFCMTGEYVDFDNVLKNDNISLDLKTYCTPNSDLPNFYIIIAFMGLVLIIMSYYLLYIKNLRIDKFFLFFALFIGVLYTLILIPYNSPDEFSHFSTAYNFTNFGTQYYVPAGNNNVFMRGKDAANFEIFKIFGNSLSLKCFVDAIKQLNNTFEYPALDNNEYINMFSQINSVVFYAYLPQSIGILIGKIFDFSPIYLFYMGRILNIFAYTIIIYFAINITPIAKHLFFAIAILPMSLNLMASYSYDVLIISLAMLSIACYLRLINDYNVDMKFNKYYITMLISITLLVPIKGVYIFFFILPLSLKFIGKKNKVKNILFSALSLTFSIITLLNLNLKSLPQNMSLPHKINFAGTPVHAIEYWLKNPIEAFSIVFKTIIEDTGFYIDSMIGHRLGALVVNISPIIIYIIFIVLPLLLISEGSEKRIEQPRKILFIIIFLLTSAAILAPFLINLTPIGIDKILYIQGRYFTPVLLPLLLTFQPKNITITADGQKNLLYLNIFLIILTLPLILINIK